MMPEISGRPKVVRACKPVIASEYCFFFFAVVGEARAVRKKGEGVMVTSQRRRRTSSKIDDSDVAST